MDLTRDREAHQYAQETLGVVEPGALILVGSDVYTFTLWYYRYVEQMRPDVAVVNYAMMSFEWYQDTIAIHHPDVVQRGEEGARVSKVDLALRNLERRAVYIAKDEDAEEWSGLELTDVGSLWRASAP